MPWEIHRVMQDSQNLDALGSGTIEDNVPSFVITIKGADDLITFLPHQWFFSEVGESIFKLLYVFEALLSPPSFCPCNG